MKKKEVSDLIKFVEQAGKLESTGRFSATLKSSTESVADHSWRLTLMTFLASNELKVKLNTEEALKIAIVHDLAEALTGDIDAYHVITGKISKKDKELAERKAMKKLTQKYPFGKGIQKLWQEYHVAKTPEARFVKALDKLEAFLTILESGHKNYKQKEFYSTYADDAIAHFPELEPMLLEIKKKLKKELSKGKIKWKE